MSEMAAFLKMRGNLGLHVIECPNGKFTFRGHVPMVLAYTGPEDAIKLGQQCGMGFVAHRGVKSRVWDTREAALAEATSLGFEVST